MHRLLMFSLEREHFFFITILSTIGCLAQNPYLPPTAFIPDGEPDVFEYKGEKRLFIYGSRDERITAFCGDGHDVWSAPINDLTKWTNHGEIFHVKQVQDIGYGIINDQHFGAPDCVYNPITKKYYLYTFLGTPYKMDGVQGPLKGSKNYIPGFGDLGPKCIMASSDSPIGPFINPVVCDWPPENKDGTFDPSVLVDEQKDGSVRVYAYWGMRKGDRWAEVDPTDMHTIINPETRLPDRNDWHKTLDTTRVKTSSLFEASSIKKIDDNHYVFIYSANEKKRALSYCYASSPEGPWTYGGQIINNSIYWRGSSNHGSIVKVADQWYVNYHKPSINAYNRQAMMEPIEIKIENEKVIIPEVEMTSQGLQVNGLDAYRRYNANIIVYRARKGAYIDGTVRDPAGLNPVRGIEGPSTTVGFKYFNFGKDAVKPEENLKLKLNARVFRPLKVKVFVARPADFYEEQERILIAEYAVDYDMSSENFKDYSIPINAIKENKRLQAIGGLKSKLAVFLEFEGVGNHLMEFVELEFSKNNAPTPNPLNNIVIASTEHVGITVLPSKAREGESVKVSVYPEEGYQVKGVEVKDSTGKTVVVNENGKAPYAPASYNFFMPNDEVKIEVGINE